MSTLGRVRSTRVDWSKNCKKCGRQGTGYDLRDESKSMSHCLTCLDKQQHANLKHSGTRGSDKVQGFDRILAERGNTPETRAFVDALKPSFERAQRFWKDPHVYWCWADNDVSGLRGPFYYDRPLVQPAHHFYFGFQALVHYNYRQPYDAKLCTISVYTPDELAQACLSKDEYSTYARIHEEGVEEADKREWRGAILNHAGTREFGMLYSAVARTDRYFFLRWPALGRDFRELSKEARLERVAQLHEARRVCIEGLVQAHATLVQNFARLEAFRQRGYVHDRATYIHQFDVEETYKKEAKPLLKRFFGETLSRKQVNDIHDYMDYLEWLQKHHASVSGPLPMQLPRADMAMLLKKVELRIPREKKSAPNAPEACDRLFEWFNATMVRRRDELLSLKTFLDGRRQQIHQAGNTIIGEPCASHPCALAGGGTCGCAMCHYLAWLAKKRGLPVSPCKRCNPVELFRLQEEKANEVAQQKAEEDAKRREVEGKEAEVVAALEEQRRVKEVEQRSLQMEHRLKQERQLDLDGLQKKEDEFRARLRPWSFMPPTTPESAAERQKVLDAIQAERADLRQRMEEREDAREKQLLSCPLVLARRCAAAAQADEREAAEDAREAAEDARKIQEHEQKRSRGRFQPLEPDEKTKEYLEFLAEQAKQRNDFEEKMSASAEARRQRANAREVAAQSRDLRQTKKRKVDA